MGSRETWMKCTAPGCPMKDKWMHEECWNTVHLISPGHSKEEQQRVSSLATARVTTTLAEYHNTDTGSAVGSITSAAAGSVVDDVAFAVVNGRALSFGAKPEGCLGAGGAVTAGAVAGAAAVNALIASVETAFAYSDLCNKKITTKAFGIRATGAVTGAVGATGGGLLGAAGSCAAVGACGGGPIGATVGFVVGGMICSALGQFGGRKAGEAVARFCVGDEDNEIIVNMVIKALERLNFLEMVDIERVTVEEIGQRFRQFRAIFHPDKVKRYPGQTAKEHADKQAIARTKFCLLTSDAFLLKEWIKARDATDIWKPWLPTIPEYIQQVTAAGVAEEQAIAGNGYQEAVQAALAKK